MKKIMALLILSSTFILGCDVASESIDTATRTSSTATTIEQSDEQSDTPAVSSATNESAVSEELSTDIPSVKDLPLNADYVEINNNIPYFSDQDLEIAEPFFTNAPLDSLSRVGVADALLDQELMPSEERGSISSIYPTGWAQEKYENVSGGWLYNRSHLIGHQLTGYDEKENLITGTRQFNVDGMLPFENFVANVVEEQDLRVRYRITPIFEGDNLLAHGILMEGYSVDDDGATLTFNIFVPNEQDGVTLDYATGESTLD